MIKNFAKNPHEIDPQSLLLSNCQLEIKVDKVSVSIPGSLRPTLCQIYFGDQIPSKTVVTYWNLIAMKDERNFPEPEKFKPEGWLRGCPGQHIAHPFAAIPFSFSPLMCNCALGGGLRSWRCTCSPSRWCRSSD